jgi:hypothetical protein
MTPKEKAIELTGIYLELTKKSLDRIGWFYDIDVAKQCALTAVEAILFSNNTIFETNIPHECWKYWLEVKQEIEKL